MSQLYHGATLKNLGQTRAAAQKHSLIRDESGATAIVVACMFSLLLLVLGGLMDTARLTLAQNKLQASLDAAAIAAVRDASTLDVQQEVTKFFNANFPTNYMGMSPSAITVSQSGNDYTFTTSSPLPYSIMGATNGTGTITVESKVSTGSSSGQGAEIALILDNSASMNTTTSSGTTRLALMKSAVSNLMDRIATSNTHISMVNFNNAIRVSTTEATASPRSWLNLTPSVTAASFAAQNSMSNSGRFDGCLSTKSQEVNNLYPQSNSNVYLMNNDENPTVGGKFRQYIGPVDYASYYSPLQYSDYIFKQTNTSDGSIRGAHVETHNYVNGQDFVYDGTSPPASSGIAATPYGTPNIRDNYNATYTYTVSGGGLTPSTVTDAYVIYNEFTAAAGEISPHTPTGAATNLLYTRVDPVNYDDPITGNLLVPFYLQRSYTKTSSSWSVSSSWSFKRTLSLGHNYAYAFKVYMGYKPATSTTVGWTAYSDTGATLVTSSAPWIATTGSMGNKDKYVADIFIPLAYRPISAIQVSYPAPYISITSCDSSGTYAYCKEVRKVSTSSTFSTCKQCSPSGCGTNTPNSASCFGLTATDYSTYNWFFALGEPGPIITYPTCGALANSLFLKTDATVIKTASTNLVAGGPARVNVGLNWGWRTLSPKWRNLFNNTVATYPLDYNNSQNKIAVLMTQGDNFRNKAKTENTTNGTATGTYFDDDSFATLCTNMKNQGIQLYVIGIGVTAPATVARLQACATSITDTYANVSSTSDAAYSTILGKIADRAATSPSGSLQFH